MKIKNEPTLSHEELLKEIDKGATFVSFTYVISFLFTSRVRTSGVYIVRKGERRFSKGLPHTLASLFFGWWAFPFGPRNTIRVIRSNFAGGTDVTSEVNDTVAGFLLFNEAERRKAS